MDADFSIELGRGDPVLDFPWKDPSGRLAFVDLKRRPDLLTTIEEANKFPELGDFLRSVNAARSPVQSAKCDVWSTTDLSAEEEIYHGTWKFASYVDVVFEDGRTQRSLPAHELFVRRLVGLLQRAPETPSTAEVLVRRCYFATEDGEADGFYCTVYVNGYGTGEADARRNWGVALKLVGNAAAQFSQNSSIG